MATSTKSLEIVDPQKHAQDLYEKTFGKPKELVVAKAGGRVNLIGEHVDYNMGYVMPIAIDRYTAVVGSVLNEDEKKNGKGKDFSIVVPNYSNPGNKDVLITWDRKDFLENSRPVKWHNYVRGVAAMFESKGIKVPPFKAAIVGNVPQGGGLSSSASLEVATASFLEVLCGTPIKPLEKAVLCQTVEHKWCDVPCGIMDQFASVFGQKNRALLIDCKSNTHSVVKMEDTSVSVLIVNSNVKHALVDSAYKKRKAACESAAEKLKIASLREISLKSLEAGAKDAKLTPNEFQRARHVVSEIERTAEAAEALKSNEYVKMGKLMNESHASLRDLYEVSCKELDILVKSAQDCKNSVFGARMTGAGFGGSIVALVKAKDVLAVQKYIDEAYTKATGKKATFISSPPAAGAMSMVVKV